MKGENTSTDNGFVLTRDGKILVVSMGMTTLWDGELNGKLCTGIKKQRLRPPVITLTPAL
jgi:hypothetical protein